MNLKAPLRPYEVELIDIRNSEIRARRAVPVREDLLFLPAGVQNMSVRRVATYVFIALTGDSEDL